MNGELIVKAILRHVEDNLSEALSLDLLSKELNYSKFYLSRIFAEYTGLTLYRYIQGRRLTEAARKLAESKEPIIDIAYEARYNSQQAFTLAFSRLYFCTPMEYRNNGIFYPKQPILTMTVVLSGMASRHNTVQTVCSITVRRMAA